jgi:hypothetical protein
MIVSDGHGAIQVTGAAGNAGDFIVLTGSWDGSVFLVQNLDICSMIYIPAGSYLMGNSNIGNDAPPYQRYEELPQHPVYVPAYKIRKYEVTRAEYRAFMDAGVHSHPAYWSTAGWDWSSNNWGAEPH